MYSKAGDDIAIDISSTIEESQCYEYEDDSIEPMSWYTEENDVRRRWAYPTEADDPNHHQSMYKAATEGDWEAAQVLLTRDKDLGWVEITDQGDRALHLAVLGEHTEFVNELIEKVGWEMLELYDGNGYTACCYAAMAGNLHLVHILVMANGFVVNVQNWHGTTPFTLAISYGHEEIVSYFLSVTEIKGLTGKQLFNILLRAIVSKMFDVALIILEKEGDLAIMQGGDGRTALHVLAKLDMLSEDAKGQADVFGMLANKLWENIQNLGKDRVVELMKQPPILHDAAKVGNLDIIKMITYDFPDLLSHIDQDNGYSIFHISVMYRQWNMLELVRKARNVKNFDAISQDKNGNNLLHSAAKALYQHEELESVADVDIEMQCAFAWFKAVEAVVPPIYGKMENLNRNIPIALFWKEHAKLLGKIEAYTKKAAESGMLISTIVMTLVFAAAFAPPGGFNQETGIPILLKSKWFSSFIVFKILALSSSTFSIIGFWSIISSRTGGYQFLVLPRYLRFSMSALLLSVLFVISAFLSAFFLVFVQEKKTLAMSLILPLYTLFVIVIFYQIFKVLWKTSRHSPMEPSSSKLN